ncbi:MAG: protein kinase [Polyangiaceae bacterium]
MSNEDDFGIIGATLANAFHVERVVAHGGFAIVYRGIHGGFRAPIALKCLRIPEGMTEEQRNTFLERFREEGELLFRLSAALPEVVRPLHIDAVYLPNGALMPFLALEWLEGEGFDQVLLRNRRERRPGMDLLTLVGTLKPVAQALVRAHHFPTEGGNICIVHRDLKPENLFLCNVAGANTIKILDYGIAEVFSVAQQVAGARAWGGMNPFTPGYGAPEQWAPDRFGACGTWTDVWGLAITMTEALAGKPAIDGEVETMRRIAMDPRRRPTPRALGANVSAEVEKVFEKALAVDPRDRTRDIETFWSQLESATGLPSTFGAKSVPGPRGSRRQSMMEIELQDAPHEASIDLDLAVAPESLRGGAPVSARSGSGPQSGVRGAREATEEDLPMYDEGPPSAPGPRSGPRSGPHGPGPISSNPAPRATGSAMPRVTSDSMPPSSRGEFDLAAAGRAAGGMDLASTNRSAGIDLATPARGPSSAPAPRGSVPGASPAPLRSASSAPPARAPMTSEADTMARAKKRYGAPAILLGVAIAIMLIDLVAVRVWGTTIAVGPVRPVWVAGPLALVGSVLLIWKVVSEEDDG